MTGREFGAACLDNPEYRAWALATFLPGYVRERMRQETERRLAERDAGIWAQVPDGTA
jgi:hypothetical protein